MRRHVAVVIAFLVGSLVGGIAMMVVTFRALDGAVYLLGTTLKVHARNLAEQAWCAGDYEHAALHGWSLLQLTPGIRTDDFGAIPHHPKTLAFLAGNAPSLTAFEALEEKEVAFHRGLVAVTFERAGMTKLADEQWNLAKAVFPHSMTKERIAMLNDARCAATKTPPKPSAATPQMTK